MKIIRLVLQQGNIGGGVLVIKLRVRVLKRVTADTICINLISC